MRFSLEGKPWTFLFWWRYRVKTDKFLFSFGAHPAMNFRTEISPITGNEMIVTRRFLAGELSPNYLVTKNISLGVYYLYSHCFDKGARRILISLHSIAIFQISDSRNNYLCGLLPSFIT